MLGSVPGGADQSLRKLYRVLLAVNRAVVRAERPDALFETVCRVLVEEDGLTGAHAWLASPPGAQLRTVAAAGNAAPALDALVSGHGKQLDHPLWVENDLLHADNLGELSAKAVEQGCRSFAGVPVRLDGRLVGVVALCSAERDFFNDDQRDLLIQLGEDLAFALDSLRARAAYAEQEQQFRALVENTTDGIFFANNAGRYTWANQAGLRLVGYTLEELTAKTIGELSAPDDPPRLARLESGPVTRPLRLKRKDGSIIDVEISARKSAEGYQSICRPMEPRRLIAAQLLVTDRLVSLGTMAAGVAHELNNPLSWIISNLSQSKELIAQVQAPAEVQSELVELIGESIEGAHRIASIVSDLRVLAKSEATTGRVPLARVLERACSMVAFQAKYRGRLEQHLGALPEVLGNEAELRQVFVNLLQNAIQALPEGAPTRNVVDVRASTDDTGRAVVEIRDTGSGIAPENLQRIFDPFFTTRPVGHGTGLGLAVAHNIVLQLGGTLEVAESTPGVGTTFRVVLPSAPPVNQSPESG